MKGNRMSRRTFLRVLGATAGAASIAACTKDETAVPEVEPTSVPPTKAAAPTSAPTDVPPPPEDVKVTLITQESEIGNIEAECATTFSEMTGIDAEVLQTTEFVTKITADFAAGGGIYDAFIAPFLRVHDWQASGHLVALDDYIASDPDIDIEDFIPTLLDAYGYWDGQQWSLPNNADTYVFFYRKDIFEDSDVQAAFKAKTGTDLKVPETVEEQKVIAEFFTKKLNPDSPLEYGFTNWSQGVGAKWWWTMRLAALGGGYFDENMHPNFNNEAGLRSLEDFLALHEFAPDDVATYEWTKSCGSFLDASAAMLDQWNAFGAMAETREGYWGLSEVVGKTGWTTPTGYMVDGKLSQSSTLGGWTAAVSKYSENPDAAYKLIAYLTGKECDPLKAATGNGAVRQSTYDNWEETPNTKHFGAVAECLAISHITGNVDAAPISVQLEDYMDTQIGRVILKEIEPEEALQLIDDEWTKLLKAEGMYG